MEILLKKPAGLRRFLQLYRLYMTAFPVSERKPVSMILRMYQKGTTDIWCLEREGKFVGLAITINGPNLILLDYFAVSAAHRSEGIGSAALPALMAHYQDKGFFLEIESTTEDATNRQQRLRRKAFYLSCGLQELGAKACLFGVNMELLGVRCRLDYSGYKTFYRDNYNSWAADHITPCDE